MITNSDFDSRTWRLPLDLDDRREVIALAWPTGRPIRRYTAAELAEGVDVYTRALKARRAATDYRGGTDET
jgi:hypothetical protein